MGRNIRKYSFLAVTILCLLFSSSALAEIQNWELEINLSKQTYLIHEPIWLDVTLTNISEDTLRTQGLYLPCQSPFIIILKNSLGIPLKYTGGQINYIKGEGVVLKAGEQQYNSFDILKLFNVSRHILSYYFSLLPPGNYTIEAHLDGAISEVVMFNIVDPTGEDSEVLDIMNEGFNLMKLKQNEQIGDKLFDILNNYPRSIYVEKALYLMGGYFTESIAEKTLNIKDLREAILKRFPNSGYNKMYLRSTIDKLSEDKKEVFLNKVIKDNPNTRSAKYARQMLKNIMKKRGE